MAASYFIMLTQGINLQIRQTTYIIDISHLGHLNSIPDPIIMYKYVNDRNIFGVFEHSEVIASFLHSMYVCTNHVYLYSRCSTFL